MRPLLYILKKTFKNHLVQLKKKPGILAIYIIFAALIIFSIVVSFKAPSNSKKGSIEVFGSIAAGGLLTITYFALKQAMTSGSSFFTMSDVNLVFTAPISSKRILAYGFMKQLYTSLFMIFFLLFQIPNLKNFFNIGVGGIFIVFSAIFLYMFGLSIITMLVYSAASKSAKVKKNLERALNAVLVLFGVSFILVFLNNKNIGNSMLLFLNSSCISYIPFIGWVKSMMMSAISGLGSRFYINLLLITVFIILIAYILYKLDMDYYEEVIAVAEKRQEQVNQVKEGRYAFSGKRTKYRKVKANYKGSGARALFYRQLLEYNKSGFMFLDKLTIILIAVGLGSKMIFKTGGLSTILYAAIYALFFFSLAGKWEQELNKHYIYVLPDSSMKKVFYATLPENLKNLVNGFALFITSGIVYKADVISIILCAFAYATAGSIYIYGGVFGRRVLGGVHSKNLQAFIKVFLVFFIIAPGIIFSAIFLIVYKGSLTGSYFSYIVMIAYNCVASSIIIAISKGIFENVEMN